MSVQPVDPNDDSKLYCTVDDVASFFDKFDNGFDSTTNPTADDVRLLIADASDYIDSYTNHAWRARRVTNEYKDLENNYRFDVGVPIQLQHRDIRSPLDESKGDKLEIWEGDGYEDWVSSSEYEQARDGDFWIEEPTGSLYIYRRYVFYNRKREIRLNYRYGKETVPGTIKMSAAKLTAADLMESDFYRVTVPGNEDAPDSSQTAQSLREEVKERLDRYKELQLITT